MHAVMVVSTITNISEYWQLSLPAYGCTENYPEWVQTCACTLLRLQRLRLVGREGSSNNFSKKAISCDSTHYGAPAELEPIVRKAAGVLGLSTFISVSLQT